MFVSSEKLNSVTEHTFVSWLHITKLGLWGILVTALINIFHHTQATAFGICICIYIAYITYIIYMYVFIYVYVLIYKFIYIYI